jgi:long-chain acyl-CoA synthetase
MSEPLPADALPAEPLAADTVSADTVSADALSADTLPAATVPAGPAAESLPAAFRVQAERLGDELALMEHGGASMTWREWSGAVDACAASLLAAGHVAGERAAVFAGNTLLWPVADMAVQGIGMVCTGIFPSAAPAQVREILADADITAVFVDAPERLAAVLAAMPAVPSVRTVVAACDIGSAATAFAPTARSTAPAAPAVRVVRWSDWLSAGALAGAPRWSDIRAHDDAIIIYTSGSTGTPKGARISHRYLLAAADSISRTLRLGARERSLSFLPFSHAAERVFGHARRILDGDTTLLVGDHRQLWQAAASFRPTVFGGLPRFYEKLYELLIAHRSALHGEDAAAWDAGLELGRRRSALRRAGAALDPDAEARWYNAIAQQRVVLDGCLGDAVRVATSGGAALPADVAHYLDACGLTVLGAYGLTEHLCVASHRPGDYDFEGVGPAMAGTTLRVADDGEILVLRGDLTFTGYLGRDEETQAMFTSDGAWLRTGDLGRLDDAQRLYVTGRLKELIALSTGRKVAPAPIEASLVEDPWIAQAMLYGEGRKYVTALLVLRRAVVGAWAAQQNITVSWDELLQSATVHARTAAVVDGVNARLSAPERIRRFVLLDRELSAELDEVTPTLKIRRQVVTRHFADRLDALYEQGQS